MSSICAGWSNRTPTQCRPQPKEIALAAARARASRIVAALIVPIAVLGGAGLASSPAAAAEDVPTVSSGDARFEVLSPTLIRSEYAGDGVFTDEATFNAIGPRRVRPARLHLPVADGWLTIDTGRGTLRYRVGSGTSRRQPHPRSHDRRWAVRPSARRGDSRMRPRAPWRASARPKTSTSPVSASRRTTRDSPAAGSPPASRRSATPSPSRSRWVRAPPGRPRP